MESGIQHTSDGCSSTTDPLRNRENPLRILLSRAFLVFALAWVVGVWYYPHARADPMDENTGINAQRQVALRLLETWPERLDYRVVQRGGFNLEIWVVLRDFESIPYPDRKGFVEKLGKTWCEHPDLKEHQVWLPSVSIRDLRNGKEVASHSCILSRTSIE
jgi:hypothetical protein